MKRIITVIFLLFISFLIMPTIKAEEKYYELNFNNMKTPEDFQGDNAIAAQLLYFNGIITSEEDGPKDIIFHNGKAIFIMTMLNDEIITSIPDDVTYLDNFVYKFTPEDLTNLANYPSFSDYDGIKVILRDDCINKVCITSTVLEERKGNAYVMSINLSEDLLLNWDVSLKEVGDLVKYKITITNHTEEDYKLNVERFNNSEFIKYSYNFEDGKNELPANSEKDLYLTIEYSKEVPLEQRVDGFTEKNRMILTTNDVEDISNPKTGYLNIALLLVLMVVISTVSYILLIKKHKKISLTIMIFALLTPIITYAVSELTITFNTKVTINDGSTLEIRYPNGYVVLEEGQHMEERDFWNYANYIKRVIIKDDFDEPDNYIYRYDISASKDGTIIAYLVPNITRRDYWDLYITSNGVIYTNEDSSYFFHNMRNLESIVGLENLNTSKTKNMVAMFAGCESLKSLDLSHFDTSNVITMAGMFSGYSSSTPLDLSHLNTSNVTSMAGMFSAYESSSPLDLSHLDTSKVTNMSGMFYSYSSSAPLDLSHLDTRNVINMSDMFEGSHFETLDLSNFNTSKVLDMSGMFAGMYELKSLNIRSFNTSQVTDMNSMFSGCNDLLSLDLSNFNTSKVTNMAAMFYDCSSLTTLNLSSFDTSKVTKMETMFYNCSGLTSLNVSSFDTSKVTDMQFMFYWCESLTSLNLSHFNTENVLYM